MGKIIPIQSFLIVLRSESGSGEFIGGAETFTSFCEYFYANLDEVGIELSFHVRGLSSPVFLTNAVLQFLLGDDREWDNTQGRECMAHAAIIEIDRRSGFCKILTSIIGLPPIFVYRDNKKVVLTSDIYLLTKVKSVRLAFDPQSILDLCRVGHPIDGKTLFKDVTRIPCGSSVSWKRGTALTIKKSWELPKRIPSQDWETYCEDQINCFRHAIERMSLNDSFLSLTGGLDTRTILAALIQAKKGGIASYTLSGNPLTLDARRASTLCRRYGINHRTIVLGDTFFRNLEKYAIEASRLSGGNYSLEQAHEVFFYEEIGRRYTGRVSGNIGNQVARWGTEGASVRNGNSNILHPDFFCSGNECDSTGHPFLQMNSNSRGLDFMSLLQNELPNSSVGNYCVGNYFAVQKSPYADKRLIEVSQNMPGEEKGKQSVSLVAIRIMDLRHRFLGEPKKRSFQRKFINSCGGFVAYYPINWGWRPRGGISLPGIFLGGLSMIDALAEKRMVKSVIAERALALMKISGLHRSKRTNVWMRKYLKSFVYDNLYSKSMDGFLNKKVLENVLHEYFYKDKNKHHTTVSFALDFSIANELFRRGPYMK